VLAAVVLLCPAGRATADVVTVGVVAPVPPSNGGTFTSQLIVGEGDDDTSNDIWGWVSVDDGTLLQYGSLIVGDELGYFGEINVSGNFLAGVNTQLNLSAQGSTSSPTVQIGNEGTGWLGVSGGSKMTLTNQAGDMSIGVQPTGVGYATVSDRFTILTVSDFLFVGQSGVGSLEVLNGALVRTLDRGTSRFIGIGTNPTGVGTVVVDGQGSILRSASSLVVGGTTILVPPTELYGQGTLRISNGGMVDVATGITPTITVGRLGRIELEGGTLTGFTPPTGVGTTVNGYLGGSGLVRGSALFGDDSFVEANPGDNLRFDGDVSNQGAVNIDNGEVRFLRGFTNNAQGVNDAPGRISLENGGTVRFTETLINDGVLSSAHETTHIHGEITNQNAIVVARDTVATFYDSVNNTTGTITVKPGGNALFLADLAFVGLGSLALGVGTNDLGDSSSQISAGGVVTLGGTLEITFDGGYTPAAGQIFELISAGGGISGAFDSMLFPLMPQDLEVGVLYSPTSVMMEIKIIETSLDLPGDYNNDGFVDAADYTVWRNKLGSATSLPNDNTPGVGQDDYTRWKANFGQVAGSGAGSIAPPYSATPEPSTPLLALSGLAILLNLRATRLRQTSRAVA
jgi:T5SS/PEP-CTERM-associated repeat protein